MADTEQPAIMNQLTVPQGSYRLQRLPASQQQPLQAWDAADEFILRHLAEQQQPEDGATVLIVNDSFGALSCALHRCRLFNWSDSRLSHLAAEQNLAANQLSPEFKAISSVASPDAGMDLVIIKMPKTLALLEHQLIVLASLVKPDTVIIAAGMVKYLQKSHQQLLERYIGPTTTSRAVKKARLYFPVPAITSEPVSSPYPDSYYLEPYQLHISNHANVFSRDKLDIGARFMLQQFDRLPNARRIVDLGCGNGILGILAQRQQPDASVYFVDESYMALDSARQNYRAAFTASAHQSSAAHFLASNCLEQTDLSGVDLILCNPPFHQNHTVGDQIAWAMFVQSKQALATGGILWVIGNRHLQYYAKLKKVFGNCTTVGSDKKFVLLAAHR